MGAAPANPYVWPTLAQSGALGLLGLYGLISWRHTPRLALAGLALFIAFSRYGRNESLGIVDVVLADYGKLGRFPTVIFWGTQSLFVSVMVVLPILALISL